MLARLHHNTPFIEAIGGLACGASISNVFHFDASNAAECCRALFFARFSGACTVVTSCLRQAHSPSPFIAAHKPLISKDPEADKLIGGDGSVTDAGLAYVFSRNADTWDPIPDVLDASNRDSSDEFGTALALSADGASLVVGAYAERSGATGINGDDSLNGTAGAGAGYLYTLGSGGWSQQAYVKASNPGSPDMFTVGTGVE